MEGVEPIPKLVIFMPPSLTCPAEAAKDMFFSLSLLLKIEKLLFVGSMMVPPVVETLWSVSKHTFQSDVSSGQKSFCCQVRTGGNSLTSSYVNLDREPLFYKNTKQVIATTSSSA